MNLDMPLLHDRGSSAPSSGATDLADELFIGFEEGATQLQW